MYIQLFCFTFLNGFKKKEEENKTIDLRASSLSTKSFERLFARGFLILNKYLSN